MDVNNIYSWAGGGTLIITGSCLLYFEGYRNIEWLSAFSGLFIIFGWIIYFIKVTKNTAVDAAKIYFSDDKIAWLKQNVLRLWYYAFFMALGFGNFHYVAELATDRKRNILRNEPTASTTAVVTDISVIRGRSSVSYYAIFEYVANGKLTQHPWHEENKNDFIVRQRFIIRYSISHPEMFTILKEAGQE